MKEDKKEINLPFFLYVLFERVRVYIYFALRILPEKRSIIRFFGKIIREHANTFLKKDLNKESVSSQEREEQRQQLQLYVNKSKETY